MLTDTRGTLSRIDPVQNVVVAELRVYADCNTPGVRRDARCG